MPGRLAVDRDHVAAAAGGRGEGRDEPAEAGLKTRRGGAGGDADHPLGNQGPLGSIDDLATAWFLER